MLVIREAIVKTDQLRLVGDLNNLATSEIQAEGIGALGVARTQRRYADGEKYLNEVSEFAGELPARQREQEGALYQASAAMLQGERIYGARIVSRPTTLGFQANILPERLSALAVIEISQIGIWVLFVDCSRHTVPHSDSANPIPGQRTCVKVMMPKHLRAIRGLGAELR